MLLGIDIGTSGTKVILVEESGKVVASATVEYPLHQPKPGWSEQDPVDWWHAVCNGTQSVLKSAKVRGSSVAAIGFSGQMHSSVFMDANGKVLRRAILWNDQRTAEQCEQITEAAGGRAALIRMVANPALTGYTAPKILWLRQHEPRKYEKVRQILLPKDYVRFRMTGEYVSDVSDAAGTLLLDVRRRKWCTPLLEKLGIDASLLPPLVESPEIAGRLTEKAAEAMGLPAGVPVVGGAGDQAAAAVGNGIVKEGIISATLGTSGVVFAHSGKFAPNKDGAMQSFCHAMPGAWCVLGCMLSGGGSLRWLRDVLWAEQVAGFQRKRGGDASDLYPQMIAEAEAAAGCEAGLFFLPYLTGERCPHYDPAARGAWVGLTSRHRRGHLVRAVLEGITFGMRDQVEILRSTGVKITQVRTGGGGARSDFWRQLQADIYGAPVVTVSSTEGSAYGAALLAGVGGGVWSSVPQACQATIKPVDRRRPRAAAKAKYQKAYELFRRLYHELREINHAMTALEAR